MINNAIEVCDFESKFELPLRIKEKTNSYRMNARQDRMMDENERMIMMKI